MDLNRRIELLARLERRLVQGAESAKVKFNRMWRSFIKRLAMVPLVLLTSNVGAEQTVFDFNLITLPTDLIATVSIVEDGITSSARLPSLPASAEEITQPVLETGEPTADEVDPELASVAKSEAEPEVDNTQLLSAATMATESDTSITVTAEPASDSTEKEPETADSQLQSGQNADSNTDLPAVEPEIEQPTPSLVAAADPEAHSQQDEDDTLSEIAPATTEQQTVIQQQEALLDAGLDTQPETKINEDEIILAWATAWSNNDVEQYLSFYSDEFTPDDPTLDRAAWEQLRRKRLQNKNIRIIVSNAEVHQADGKITEVRFTQRYTSQNYRDRVIKSIEMKQTPEGWKFLSERTIETLPFE